MRKVIVFLGFLILALFISGGSCEKTINDSDGVDVSDSDVMEDKEDVMEDKDVMPAGLAEGNVLIDRIRHVQGGNPPFDVTNVIFTQKQGKGYKAEISSGQEVNVQIMTDKDCLLKAQGAEFNVINSKKGNTVVLYDGKLEGVGKNLCVDVTALGEGKAEINFKVIELS